MNELGLDATAAVRDLACPSHPDHVGVLRLDEERRQPRQRLADAVLLHLLEPPAAVAVRTELLVVVVVVVVVRVVGVMVIVVVVMVVIVVGVVGVVVVVLAVPQPATAPVVPATAGAVAVVVAAGAVRGYDGDMAVAAPQQRRETDRRDSAVVTAPAATVTVVATSVVVVVLIVVVVMVVVVLVRWTRRQDGARLAGDGELADAEGLGALRLRRDQGREGQKEHGGGQRRDASRHRRRSWPTRNRLVPSGLAAL
jgi:hypothetical protein